MDAFAGWEGQQRKRRHTGEPPVVSNLPQTSRGQTHTNTNPLTLPSPNLHRTYGPSCALVRLPECALAMGPTQPQHARFSTRPPPVRHVFQVVVEARGQRNTVRATDEHVLGPGRLLRTDAVHRASDSRTVTCTSHKVCASCTPHQHPERVASSDASGEFGAGN